MKGSKKAAFIAVGILMLGLVFYSAYKLFVQEVFSYYWQHTTYHKMLIEIVGLLVYFSLLYGKAESRRIRLFGSLAAVLLFAWVHVILFPFLLSGFYVVYVWLCGRLVRQKIIRIDLKPAVLSDFLFGCAVMITGICLMSAFRVGAVLQVKKAVLAGAVLLAFVYFLPMMRQLKQGSVFRNWLAGGEKLRPGQAVLGALLVTLILIQAGRMNISMDYDTLWYGVRPEYILSNSPLGIYENLGTVGIAYTYSKGWEVLTLPLADFRSFTYLTSFNLWASVLALAAAYNVSRELMPEKYARLTVVLLAGIPGIMNMAVTAKSDIITLLCQLVMIYDTIYYFKTNETKYLINGTGLFFLSWVFKPTSLVFSTAVYGMSGLFILFTRQLRFNSPARAYLILAPVISAVTGIWARTILLTGVPITSVFTSVFNKLGFQVKYPYSIQSVPNAASDSEGGSAVILLLKRLYGMFVCPDDPDMAHVILAWGGMLIMLFLLLYLVSLFLKKHEFKNHHEQILSRYTVTVMIPFLFVNLISLIMLWQVDGNYFMLAYALTVIFGCRLISRLYEKRLHRQMVFLLGPAVVFNLLMVSLSSWSWSMGFSEIQLINKGYFDHREEWHQKKIEDGNSAIWDILAQNPRARVIALGNHPTALMFPCSVQSYVDVSSSYWGNLELGENVDNFVEYLTYAKTDFIYMEAFYMGKQAHRYQLMRGLIQAGVLKNIKTEWGNLIASVDVSAKGEADPDIVRYLEIFDTAYYTSLPVEQ